MRIGLIDVDGHNYPNLPLMKLSAYHKAKGDSVEWYQPMFSGHMDKVYMSKVFSFSKDYEFFIDADEIQQGGSGYAIHVDENGIEHFDKSKNQFLPDEVEHMFPDYSIYYDIVPESRFTAYGFLTRGCPRGCDFCIVKDKDGQCSRKVADLSEFWNGQKYIELLDPNMFACRDWRDLAKQLIDSKAWVNFNQGVDIRIMTEEMASYIKQMKIKTIHFAWDRYKDKDMIVPRFKMFKDVTGWDRRKLVVYVLCNFDSTMEQNLERIYTLKGLGYDPYVMLYDKESIPRGHILKKLQRWVNNRFVWTTNDTFEDYLKNEKGMVPDD